MAHEKKSSTNLKGKLDVLKSVHFDACATTYSSNKTMEEVIASWYSKDELSDFKNDRKDFVRALAQTNFNLDALNSSIYCSRGFEAYFSIDTNRATRRKRAFMIKSVLEEQRRQREQRIFDAQSMESVCIQLTQWAKDRAIQLGVQDEKDSFLFAVALYSENKDDDKCLSLGKRFTEKTTTSKCNSGSGNKNTIRQSLQCSFGQARSLPRGMVSRTA